MGVQPAGYHKSHPRSNINPHRNKTSKNHNQHLEKLVQGLRDEGNNWLARQLTRLNEDAENKGKKDNLSAELLRSLTDRVIKYLKIRREYKKLLGDLIHLNKTRLAHKVKKQIDFLRYKMECDYERRENQYAYLDNSRSLIRDLHKYIKKNNHTPKLKQSLNSKLLSDTMHSPFPQSFPFSDS